MSALRRAWAVARGAEGGHPLTSLQLTAIVLAAAPALMALLSIALAVGGGQ